MENWFGAHYHQEAELGLNRFKSVLGPVLAFSIWSDPMIFHSVWSSCKGPDQTNSHNLMCSHYEPPLSKQNPWSRWKSKKPNGKLSMQYSNIHVTSLPILWLILSGRKSNKVEKELMENLISCWGWVEGKGGEVINHWIVSANKQWRLLY